MKTTFRALTGLSALAIASPAYAHHGDSASHWLTNPAHILPVIAAATLIGAVLYIRRQRG